MLSVPFPNTSNAAPDLKSLLTESEYRIVQGVAARRYDCAQLPMVAWSMGFVSIEQLGELLNGETYLVAQG
ncbi:MAG: DUF2949 domain-containing protein [Gemmatimonadaceae bacterium]|nr:DUF2949 domain-containing protein [Gloeobacterales cyanobacterium ES-bin-141]